MSSPLVWTVAPLAALCEKISDGSHNPPKAQDTGLPMLSARNVADRTIKFDDYRLISEHEFAEEDRRTRVAQGDVLLTIVGAIGRTAVVPSGIAPFTLQRSVAVLKLREGDSRYLSYALEAPLVQRYLQDNAKGTAQKGIYLKALAAVEVPVAPLPEQQRIADKLDTVLARVDAVNDRLARVAPLLKRFRQSVLAAATSGRLTADWRGQRASGTLREMTLQAVCQQGRVITYGVVKLGAEVEGGTPCLRTSNVRWLHFELEGKKRIDPLLSAEYSRTVLRGGEVLVNVRGTLGGVAVAMPLMAGWNVSREVAVVPVDEMVANSNFIAHWVATEACQRWLTGVAKGVAYTGINIEDLRNLPLSLPPLDEQTEIVRRVDLLFGFADRLEARLQAAQTASSRLTPSLLAKAFRGELVPQDPNDEPASELLKRLVQSQPVGAKKGRARKSP
jgi:type I restriction enzyme S subunit